MGDEVHQDKAIAIAVVHKVVEILETGYHSRRSDGERKIIANVTVFVFAYFFAGLREEETLKIVLGETRNYIEESQGNLQHKHVILPLRSIFKGENGEGLHFVVVSLEIFLGLCKVPWVIRDLDVREMKGKINGFFFADQYDKKMKLKDLEGCMLDRIALI